MFAKLVAVSLLTLASGQLLAAECKVTVDSTDQMSFNTKAIEIDKSCKQFTVELTHSGNLPKNVMGHNWVLTTAANVVPMLRTPTITVPRACSPPWSASQRPAAIKYCSG